MPTDEVARYYLSRTLASVAMSRAASEPLVRNIHLELARRYAELAGGPSIETEDHLILTICDRGQL